MACCGNSSLNCDLSHSIPQSIVQQELVINFCNHSLVSCYISGSCTCIISVVWALWIEALIFFYWSDLLSYNAQLTEGFDTLIEQSAAFIMHSLSVIYAAGMVILYAFIRVSLHFLPIYIHNTGLVTSCYTLIEW
jgi:hypothetical protein